MFADIQVIGRAAMPSDSPGTVLVSTSCLGKIISSLPSALSEVPVLDGKLYVHSSCGWFFTFFFVSSAFSAPLPLPQ